MMSPTGGCAAAGGTATESSKGNRSIAVNERCIVEPAHMQAYCFKLLLLQASRLREHFRGKCCQLSRWWAGQVATTAQVSKPKCKGKINDLFSRCTGMGNYLNMTAEHVCARGQQMPHVKHLYVIQIAPMKSPFNKPQEMRSRDKGSGNLCCLDL